MKPIHARHSGGDRETIGRCSAVYSGVSQIIPSTAGIKLPLEARGTSRRHRKICIPARTDRIAGRLLCNLRKQTIIHLPDDKIHLVGYIKIPPVVNGNTRNIRHPGSIGRPSVATIASVHRPTHTRIGTDHTRVVYLPDTVIGGIVDKHVPAAIERHLPRAIEFGIRRRTAIARIPRCSFTGHRGNDPRRIDFPYSAIPCVRYVNIAGMVKSNPIAGFQLRQGRRAAVAAKSGYAGTCKSIDDPRTVHLAYDARIIVRDIKISRIVWHKSRYPDKGRCRQRPAVAHTGPSIGLRCRNERTDDTRCIYPPHRSGIPTEVEVSRIVHGEPECALDRSGRRRSPVPCMTIDAGTRIDTCNTRGIDLPYPIVVRVGKKYISAIVNRHVEWLPHNY